MLPKYTLHGIYSLIKVIYVLLVLVMIVINRYHTYALKAVLTFKMCKKKNTQI